MPTISARGPASGPSSASNRRDLGKTSSSHQRDALDRNAPKSPPTPRDQQQQRARIQCPLGIHDENFSREDVLLDVGLFPKDTVTSGDLVEVAALRANVTFPSQTTLDAAPKAPANARHTRSGKHQLADRLPHLTADGQQPSGPRGNPYSGSAIRTTDRRDLDPQKRYIFVVKELSPELKLKHSNLQVS